MNSSLSLFILTFQSMNMASFKWPLTPHLGCHRSGPGCPVSPGAAWLLLPLPPIRSLQSCPSEQVVSPFASEAPRQHPEQNLNPSCGPQALPTQFSTVLTPNAPSSRLQSRQFSCNSRICPGSCGPRAFMILLLLPRMLPLPLLSGSCPFSSFKPQLNCHCMDRPPLTPVSLHPWCHKCHFTALSQ